MMRTGRGDGACLAGRTRDDTPHFDRLARAYRWMEWLTFGPYLSRCRRAFLPQIRDAKRALVLGDGDGRFTAALLRENAHILVDAVDASQAMVRGLRRRAAANSSRLTTAVQDVREWEAQAGSAYDLVATHFFLDCLTTDEVSALAGRAMQAARPGTRWVVSEFAVPEGGFGRWVARPVVTVLYRAFGVLTGLRVRRLPDYAAALRAAGFRLEEQRTWLLGLLVAQLWRKNERETPGTAPIRIH